MATFDIPITVPDASVNDLVAALRWRHGQVLDETDPENPVMRDRTVAELRAILKHDVTEDLKTVVVRHKKWLAAESVKDSIEAGAPDIV